MTGINHETRPSEQEEDGYDVEAEKAKTRAMTERIYGKDIYADYEEPASVTPVTGINVE